MAPPRKDKDGFKVCKTCGQEKPVANFHEINKERYKQPVYRPHCKPCHLVNGRREYHTLRYRALVAYSGKVPKCACCGESEYGFLAIDHINNDGADHRKTLNSKNIVHWLSRNKFPPGFQVLCHNCNTAKGIYGRCPHQGEVNYGPRD